MFTTKKDVDKHVKSSLSKLNENEVSARPKIGMEKKFAACLPPWFLAFFANLGFFAFVSNLPELTPFSVSKSVFWMENERLLHKLSIAASYEMC